MRKFIAMILTVCLLCSVAGCAGVGGDRKAPAAEQNATQPSLSINPTTGKKPSATTAPSNPPATTAPSNPPATTAPYQPPAKLNDDMLAMLAREVSFGSNDFAALQAQLASLQVTYPHEELYGILDAYARYTAIPSYTSTHENYFADGVFTPEELFTIVKQNNADAAFPSVKQITDEDLKLVCQIIAPLLLEYGQAMAPADAALLSEKVSSLTVYTYTGFSAGAYDANSDQLGLDVTQKNTDRFSRTIQHEAHHMLQSSSQKEAAAGDYQCRYGFAYLLDEADEQPLNLSWITEGSAELLTHNRLASREYDVYQDIIRTINYIKVATILRPDIDDTSFEKLSLSADFNSLFRYFHCQTDAERQEVLHMVAAINYAANLQMCRDGLRHRYEEKYGESLSDSSFRLAVSNALGISLSRHFFQNLTAVLNNQTVTLEDIFTLCALYEHRLTDYSLSKGPESSLDLLLTYRDLQTQFFSVIASNLGITTDALYAIYDSYYVEAELRAADLPFLSAEEAKFLQYTTDSSINPRYRSVNQWLIRIGK